MQSENFKLDGMASFPFPENKTFFLALENTLGRGSVQVQTVCVLLL